MASTAVVDFANFVPQEVRVLTEEEEYDENVIEETYRKLAAHGITKENICILTDYSPALTTANKHIILQRYSDEQEARSHLIEVNHLVEYIVINCYGENDIDIPARTIVQYICERLMRIAGIDMLTDLPRLTEGCSKLTYSAKNLIIYIHGEERGRKIVNRVNTFISFLFDNGWNHLFVAEAKLSPYKGVVENGCPICLDDNTENLVSTPCNHIYHTACIEEWLKTNTNCPLCRIEI